MSITESTMKQGIEALPLYPVELLNKPEIHNYIPHLPVDLLSVGDVSIPLYNFDTNFEHRLGLLVAKKEFQPVYSILLLPEKSAPLPNSIGYRHKVAEQISMFRLDESKKEKHMVKAYNKEGYDLSLSERGSKAVAILLVGAVKRAKQRNDIFYSENK